MTFELAGAPSPRDRARRIARESVQKIPDAELKRPKWAERRFNKILEELSDQEEALVVKSTYGLVALLQHAKNQSEEAGGQFSPDMSELKIYTRQAILANEDNSWKGSFADNEDCIKAIQDLAKLAGVGVNGMFLEARWKEKRDLWSKIAVVAARCLDHWE